MITHNSRNSDLHHMMSAIGKFEDKKIWCILINMEKYISFSFDNLRFIDYLQFLNASLGTLVNNLANKGGIKFQNLFRHFPTENERHLLLRKDVCPYDYMSSWDCFHDTQLPSITAFYNKLSDSEIYDQDYAHAKNVWETFHLSTIICT